MMMSPHSVVVQSQKPKNTRLLAGRMKLDWIPRNLALAILLAFFLLPLVWMLIMSLRPNSVNTSGLIGLPFHPTFQHYVSMFSQLNVIQPLRNSLESSLITTGASLIIGIPSAYGLSHLRLRWDWTFILLPRMLPFIAVAIPWYIVFLFLHLLGTVVAISVAALVVSLPILVWSATSYFSTIPRELEEAAAIDGATSWQTLWRVVLPAGLPGVIAGGILAWINAWNMFFFPLILGGASSGTLPVAAAQYVGYGNIDYGGLAAIATLMLTPILIVVLFLQRYIVAGLTSGAVKG